MTFITFGNTEITYHAPERSGEGTLSEIPILLFGKRIGTIYDNSDFCCESLTGAHTRENQTHKVVLTIGDEHITTLTVAGDLDDDMSPDMDEFEMMTELGVSHTEQCIYAIHKEFEQYSNGDKYWLDHNRLRLPHHIITIDREKSIVSVLEFGGKNDEGQEVFNLLYRFPLDMSMGNIRPYALARLLPSLVGSGRKTRRRVRKFSRR